MTKKERKKKRKINDEPTQKQKQKRTKPLRRALRGRVLDRGAAETLSSISIDSGQSIKVGVSNGWAGPREGHHYPAVSAFDERFFFIFVGCGVYFLSMARAN